MSNAAARLALKSSATIAESRGATDKIVAASSRLKGSRERAPCDSEKSLRESSSCDKRATGSAAALRVGDYVQVVYDPTDPTPASTARIATFDRLWGGSFVMLFIGGMSAALAAFVWFVVVRGRHSN